MSTECRNSSNMIMVRMRKNCKLYIFERQIHKLSIIKKQRTRTCIKENITQFIMSNKKRKSMFSEKSGSTSTVCNKNSKSFQLSVNRCNNIFCYVVFVVNIERMFFCQNNIITLFYGDFHCDFFNFFNKISLSFNIFV